MNRTNIIDHPGQTLLFADLATIDAKSTAHDGKRATISKGGASTHAGKKRRANANDEARTQQLKANLLILGWLARGL